MKRILLCALFCTVGAADALAQQRGCWGQPAGAAATEITERDFSALPRLCSTNLTVYGIRLGMTISEARRAMEEYELSGISRAMDFLLGKRVQYLHVVWHDKELLTLTIRADKVDEITILAAMRPHLPGDHGLFFTSDMVALESTLRHKYFGVEDRVTRERLGQVEITSFHYDAEGLEITNVQNPAPAGPDVRITFSFPSKKRS